MKARFSAIGVARALRHRDFAIYTAGSSVSLIGTWMQRIAVGWMTWELTRSGAWLGAMAFADLCPGIVVGPFAGAVADRWPRLYVTRVTQSLNFLQALALFALTATGEMSIWLLFALTAAGGVIAGFNQPARLALVPSLVPRPDMMAALALNSIVFNLARFIGPAVAGLMIATTGLASAFAVNAASFLAFILALWCLRPTGAVTHAGAVPSLTEQLVEGVRYSGAHPGVASLLSLSLVTSVCSKAVAELLPGFAAAVFGRGAEGLAMLTSAIGVGAVAAGFWLGGRALAAELPRVIISASLALSVFALLFAAVDRLWAGLLFLAAIGFCMSSAGIASQTLIQMGVPNRVQGRVLSLYGLIVRGGPAIGALIMGAASEYVGFRWPVAVGAVMAAGVALWFWFRQDRFASLLDKPDEA